MIKASDFLLDRRGGHLVASCKIEGSGFPKSLWFAAETDEENALDIEEPNWAAVALLYPAMTFGQDLIIEADLSPMLFYNLNNDIQHLLITFNPNLKNIRVHAGTTSGAAHSSSEKRHVITGYSGGVDSTATFLLHRRPQTPPQMQISALAIYDVGALGKTQKAPGFEHLQNHYDNLKQFCETQDIPAFGIASNMDQVFRSTKKKEGHEVFSKTVSLRNIAATLAMQKRVAYYLPSGSVGYEGIAIWGPRITSTEFFEPILAPLLSTENLICQAGAAGLSRLQKLAYLADTDVAQKNLNVCVASARKRGQGKYINCGKCWKCVETQCILDALGWLNSFNAVFDTGYFENNKNEIIENYINSLPPHQFHVPAMLDKNYKMYGMATPEPIKKALGEGPNRPEKVSRFRKFASKFGL